MKLTYPQYLRKIAYRISPGWPYICFAVKADKLWFLNPFAWRLLREIRKMVDRSKAIYKDKYSGSTSDVCTIEWALEEKYGVRLGNLPTDYIWRLQWLNDLAAGK